MRTCVFVGPSAGDVRLPAGWDRFGPTGMGGVWRAVQAGYRRIGLVDGLFGPVPAVWHKEILYAMCNGATVYGAASMGALRAAELWRQGMVGVGAIYRYFRAGVLTNDDEVCLVHAPRDFGYRPMSLPLVSVRRTVAGMVRHDGLDRGRAARVVGQLAAAHFSARTEDALERAAAEAGLDPRGFGARFRARHRDLKADDYARLVAGMGRPAPAPPALDWGQLQTFNWQIQFEREAEDIPPLEPW